MCLHAELVKNICEEIVVGKVMQLVFKVIGKLLKKQYGNPQQKLFTSKEVIHRPSRLLPFEYHLNFKL